MKFLKNHLLKWWFFHQTRFNKKRERKRIQLMCVIMEFNNTMHGVLQYCQHTKACVYRMSFLYIHTTPINVYIILNTYLKSHGKTSENVRESEKEIQWMNEWTSESVWVLNVNEKAARKRENREPLSTAIFSLVNATEMKEKFNEWKVRNHYLMKNSLLTHGGGWIRDRERRIVDTLSVKGK